MTEAGYFEMNDTCVQGDAKVYTLYFTDDANQPLDISSWQLFHTIKASYADTDDDALSALDPTDMIIEDGDGTNDKLTFVVPPAATALMAVGTHVQDLQRVLAGVPTTLGKGQFVVEEQVTVRTA